MRCSKARQGKERRCHALVGVMMADGWLMAWDDVCVYVGMCDGSVIV